MNEQSKVKNKRKKKCPICGMNLWKRDFYRNKDGSLSSQCKECMRQMKRDEYRRNRKKPDGIFLDRNGRPMEHNGCSTRIHWSKSMCENLIRLFPRTRNEECAELLGVSPRTVVRKARELGLAKDKDWFVELARNNCRTMRVLNLCRGNSGQFKKGQHASPDTEFKKRIVNEE